MTGWRVIDRESIESKVSEVEYVHKGPLTICIVVLNCGFLVTGQTVCEDPAKYSRDKGCKLSFKDALSKLMLMERYHQSQLNHIERGKQR